MNRVSEEFPSGLDGASKIKMYLIPINNSIPGKYKKYFQTLEITSYLKKYNHTQRGCGEREMERRERGKMVRDLEQNLEVY